eukprot:TRINITY_DN10948_c0_g1_i1.p1 TRINITY_DN10948_c0_g1~~TRINITY_DN10948_c0_g1_i1.p1  ORF type:complete len:1143 (+),score=254.78 TRINITY_DN10948_c0_g1_i1:224-3652(+)
MQNETYKKMEEENSSSPHFTYKNAPTQRKVLCFTRPPRPEDYPNRKIRSNEPDVELCDNRISTSKYTCITFLPKNLMHQFSRLANVYFLIVGFMQMIKEISNSGGIPAIFLPLATIVAITAFKDLYEDYNRKKADHEENTRKVFVGTKNGFKEKTWCDVRVGDVIKIRQNEYFPADVLIIKSSDSKGIAYIETKNLDGETNLKHRTVPRELTSEITNEFDALSSNFTFEYEKPNHYIYNFTGTVGIKNKKIPLDINNFVLRGCSLRNTSEVYGLVAYTGHDTKIMLNSIRAKEKMSRVEVEMNKQIIIIFGVQLLFCLFSALSHAYWYLGRKDKVAYLVIDENDPKHQTVTLILLRYGSWMLLFTNFVPISLLVTLEMVKFAQGKIIANDKKMESFVEGENIAAIVQSSGLNEELGQIEYIFSDKTGTLTCNKMEYKNITVGGISYGDRKDMTKAELDKKDKVTNVDFEDRSFFAHLNDPDHPNNYKLKEVLLHLALCHTIITEMKDGDIAYNAASPDELALINFARFAGAKYMGTDDDNNMVVDFLGKTYRYKLLKTLEFNSTRKRMSVIVQDDMGQYLLFCKGADSIILERMIQNDPHITSTWEHLEGYAVQGLRTLVLVKKVIPEKEYKEWEVRYNQACTEMVDREKKMMDIQELIEKDMILVGATAIDDKLQDKVGETIAALKESGIKVWVLTGDKIETAINIGFSCKLLNDDMTQLIVDGKSESDVMTELQNSMNHINVVGDKSQFALVISGQALIYAMRDYTTAKRVMDVAQKCNAVIACRVSPKQKAEIVLMVRRELPRAITLAIGDGANDVNMIVAAHVGIGIKGVEGQQAARASDYAFAEFKYLRRLLYYHGREAYRRNTYLIGYNFYKNMILVIPQFWFGFLSGFSATSIYNQILIQLFNVLYASLPIVLFAIRDKEFRGSTFEKNSELYKQGMRGELFNTVEFWKWIISGMFHALLMLAITVLAMEMMSSPTGQCYGFSMLGMVVFSYVVIISNTKIAVFTNRFNFVNVLVMIASVGVYFLSVYILSFFPVLMEIHILEMLSSKAFWIGALFIVFATSFIDTAFENWRSIKTRSLIRQPSKPTLIPKEIEIGQVREPSSGPKTVNKQFTRRHTGFAFSADEGQSDKKYFQS